MANVATVGVEDWRSLIYRDLGAGEIPVTEHLVTGTRLLVKVFGRHGVRGTFLFTGPSAVAFPDLVRDVAAAGHEVACHGWAHRPTWAFAPDEFREDLRQALAALEDVLGAGVEGYRAPFFSIGPAELWALDIVAELGFVYDSSLSPLHFAAPAVGLVPGLQRIPEGSPGAGLVGLPVSVVRAIQIREALEPTLAASLMLVRGFCQKGVRVDGPTSVVLMSSVASTVGQPGLSVYAAGKAAIDGIVRCLACELAPSQIRINSIAAGAVRTELLEASLAKMSTESTRQYEGKHLLGFGTAEDVAWAAAFLLSDAARWVTGTSMVVDGGYSCH